MEDGEFFMMFVLQGAECEGFMLVGSEVCFCWEKNHDNFLINEVEQIFVNLTIVIGMSGVSAEAP